MSMSGEIKPVAGIRIESATLVCTCGHEQPTGNLPGDHEVRPQQVCSNCGANWWAPSFADCERLELANGWPGEVHSVADAAALLDSSIPSERRGVIVTTRESLDQVVSAMISIGWQCLSERRLWKKSPTQPGQRDIDIVFERRALRGSNAPVWAHAVGAETIAVLRPCVIVGIPVFISESKGDEGV